MLIVNLNIFTNVARALRQDIKGVKMKCCQNYFYLINSKVKRILGLMFYRKYMFFADCIQFGNINEARFWIGAKYGTHRVDIIMIINNGNKNFVIFTLILLEPRSKNFRFFSAESAAKGTDSRKLLARSSSTRLDSPYKNIFSVRLTIFQQFTMLLY